MAVKAKYAIIPILLIALVGFFIVSPIGLFQTKGISRPKGSAPPGVHGPADSLPKSTRPNLFPPGSADSCPVSVVASSDRTVGGSGPVTYTVDLSVLSERGDEFDILYDVIETASRAKVLPDRVFKQYDQLYKCTQSESSFKFQVDSRSVEVEHTVTIIVRSRNTACPDATALPLHVVQ
jgi:hypothetical protein